MGSLRKYLLNGAVLSAIFTGITTLWSQRKGPNDWRTVLNWVSWGLALAVAIGTVRIESAQARSAAAVTAER